MITITRRKRTGYLRTYHGEVHVCCHRIRYIYDITGVRIVSDVGERLEAEAEERSTACIVEGYWSGELNCMIDGKDEVRGWWEIITN